MPDWRHRPTDKSVDNLSTQCINITFDNLPVFIAEKGTDIAPPAAAILPALTRKRVGKARCFVKVS